MIAAISLTSFYAWWGSRVSSRPALVAFGIAALGLACDFSGESMLIAWIPRPDSSLYRAATLLSAAAGNGLYTVAGITLTLDDRRSRLSGQAGLPVLHILAWLVWLSGIALTIATIANAPAVVTLASATLMIFFIPFVVLLGRRLS
jgi:hypothetical protein